MKFTTILASAASFLVLPTAIVALPSDSSPAVPELVPEATASSDGFMDLLGSDWSDSCRSPRINNGQELYACCRRTGGSWRLSYLNLDRCIANSDGTLLARPDGGFSRSCVNCALTQSTLNCDCSRIGGGRARTGINTSPFIGNIEGLLECYGYYATPAGGC